MYLTMKLRELWGDSTPFLYMAWSRCDAIVHKYDAPPLDAAHNSITPTSISSNSLDERGAMFQPKMNGHAQGERASENDVQPVMQQYLNTGCDNAMEECNASSEFCSEAAVKNKEPIAYLESMKESQKSTKNVMEESKDSIHASIQQWNINLNKVSFVDEAARQAHIIWIKQWKDWAKKSAGMDQLTPPNWRDTKPILKCDEVNSFTWQHRNMLISLEEARQLEEADFRAINQREKEVRDHHGVIYTPAIVTDVKKVPTKVEAEKTAFPNITKLGS